ncbi:phage tail tube protein [Listeria booriae]|uniref:phage tail tube protein n=1 Tax=Listeria booriae TaxID=1552123 RepID=UPI0016278B95|nr:capsid protein [Listeria booriae]MBC2190535.1 capsid protein [Listeria booriae]
MPEKLTGFVLNALTKYDIAEITDDITTAVWLPLAAGIQNITPDADETTDDTAYFDGGGSKETTVTGVTESYTVSGHRKFGDAAQDLIASKYRKTGEDRDIFLRIRQPDAIQVAGAASLSEIKPGGGDAAEKNEFGTKISFKKVPEEVTTP